MNEEQDWAEVPKMVLADKVRALTAQLSACRAELAEAKAERDYWKKSSEDGDSGIKSMAKSRDEWRAAAMAKDGALKKVQAVVDDMPANECTCGADDGDNLGSGGQETGCYMHELIAALSRANSPKETK